MSIEIVTPTEDDREGWEALYRGYMAFYEQSFDAAFYDTAWQRFLADTEVHARVARDGDALVGLVHFLRHANTWGADVCYLQDLFTAPQARGHGVGRALIEAVVGWAREQGCSDVYWLTHTTNRTARRLYDSVAADRGFIQYEIGLMTRPD